MKTVFPRRLGMLWMVVLAVALSACASPSIEQYASEKPVLRLEQYFDGQVDAWGVVQDRSGAVIRRFSVSIDGQWEDGKGRLDERFKYADGETEQRIWNIEKIADGRYVGRADDVIGTADGLASGNALNWTYTLRLPVGDSVYDINFDDWMFLVDEDTLINRAVMSKFGIRVGEVLITFRRRSNP